MFTKIKEMIVSGLIILGMSKQDCVAALAFMENRKQQDELRDWILTRKDLIESSPEEKTSELVKAMKNIMA